MSFIGSFFIILGSSYLPKSLIPYYKHWERDRLLINLKIVKRLVNIIYIIFNAIYISIKYLDNTIYILIATKSYKKRKTYWLQLSSELHEENYLK